ncbi:MAG: hypothetical protein WDN28_30340 [Chthoniobacter sp.]
MARRTLLPISLVLLHAQAMAVATFAPGELVRATRGEMLQLDGKNYVGAAKGQEFPVLQQDAARGVIVVPFYKKDGAPVSVTIHRGCRRSRTARWLAGSARQPRSFSRPALRPRAAAPRPRGAG